MIATKVFLPTANPTRAAVIALTAAVVFPASRLANLSAYISSKLTVIKLMEFLAAENPTVFAAALHPGMVDTSILRSSGADPSKLPLDSGKLRLIGLFHGACAYRLIHICISEQYSGSTRGIYGVACQPRGLLPKWPVRLGQLGC